MALSAALWCMALTIVWMAAGRAWAGTLLGILVAVWVVLAVAAVIDFLDRFL
jgi:hypothetical protein